MTENFIYIAEGVCARDNILFYLYKLVENSGTQERVSQQCAQETTVSREGDYWACVFCVGTTNIVYE